jgi:hypothetical protein
MDKNEYFCFLPIGNDTEWAIYITLTLLSFPLAAVGLRKFCRMRGVAQPIHYLRLLSASPVVAQYHCLHLGFLGSNVYSISLYRIYNRDDYTDEEMSNLSRYSFLGDWISTFIIQLLLLYVPYRW